MNIFNPFQIEPYLNFRNFGDYFMIAIILYELIIFGIGWANLMTNRQLAELTMYATPLLFCFSVSILFWYFAIPACVLFWFGQIWVRKICLKEVEKDEHMGITATSKSQRKKQAEKWKSMSEFDKEMFLSSYTIKTLNLKILLAVSCCAPILVVLVLSIFGFHYYFF